MRSENDLDSELVLQQDFHIIEIYRAFTGLHRQFNAGPEMEGIDRPFQIIGDLFKQFNFRERETRAVAAIGHRHQFDFVMPAELTIFFSHPFIAFGACNT